MAATGAKRCSEVFLAKRRLLFQLLHQRGVDEGRRAGIGRFGAQASEQAADGPFAAQVKGMIAFQRYGRAEEIAAMVAYLAGPEAAFVTGASLKIDGGCAA